MAQNSILNLMGLCFALLLYSSFLITFPNIHSMISHFFQISIIFKVLLKNDVMFEINVKKLFSCHREKSSKIYI